MQLEKLDTSKMGDFYEARILKAVIRQLERMQSQSMVNTTEHELQKIRSHWHRQLMD